MYVQYQGLVFEFASSAITCSPFCSDQGGRKKTKIVHLPAENATEIAEEMTARFRKLQSKTDKQAVRCAPNETAIVNHA